jgi:heme-degrading monooxygenase HmoA
MIYRYWKAIAKPAEADKYIDHLQRETFPRLTGIDGFIKAAILQRAVPQGVEFLSITVWQSMESIREFAGENADVAVVPAVVQAMMIEYDHHVSHFELAHEFLP